MFDLFKREKIEVQCEFCDRIFLKGSGHLCWCPECNAAHRMCNECYKEAKKQGNIKDKQIPINFISDENKERYT